MSLCIHFSDPAQARCCRADVQYQALAGGAAHTMIFRLPCFELSNRHGEDVKHCTKYQPQSDHDE
jgi:hypothetical protein